MRTLSVVALVCLAAACPGVPKSSVGRTRETALAVMIDRSPFEVDVDSPAGPPPHWYRVTVRTPSYLSADVPDFDASAFRTEIVRLEGTEVLDYDELVGPVFVRVTGDAQPYRLRITAKPASRPEVVYEPCDPNQIDPANPRCAGVVACDHNKPDFRNPSCCAMLCLRGPCVFEIIAPDDGPEGVFAWIDSGAKRGVVRGTFGYGEVPGRDGKLKRVAVSVVEVQAERSKVLVGADVDMAHVAHSLVRLELPPPCRAEPTRRP